MRDDAGRFQKGSSGDPGGRKREGAGFEAAARRILKSRVEGDALAAVPAGARALLPASPTYQDALAAVLVAGALTVMSARFASF